MTGVMAGLILGLAVLALFLALVLLKPPVGVVLAVTGGCTVIGVIANAAFS